MSCLEGEVELQIGERIAVIKIVDIHPVVRR
jgi:hypothetical protein